MTFASCSNPSDSNSNNSGGNNTSLGGNSNNNNNNSNNNGNNENNNSGNNANNENNANNNNNPSPSLPENVGKNPITETVKLLTRKDMYLELKTDGTATYGDDYDREEEYEFKYTYDANKKEIYLKVEKSVYVNPFGENSSELMTYNEIFSKLNKDCNVENAREYFKELYEYEKDKEYFKEDFPDCNSYEDWEDKIINEEGFDSFDAYVKYAKQIYEDLNKANFGAQITYAYEIEDGKITLTEKFTGVKNLLNSKCVDEARSCRIYSTAVSIEESDIDYYGIPNIDKKTISFTSEKGLKFNATFTENIANGTVTIKFKDKEYVCEFDGEIFTQED
ncbi:MAG: hypothetical protein K2N58_02595 [Treponemataceae bacterium]|nr:hypothetical protein [Treponemataceae bacterium]